MDIISVKFSQSYFKMGKEKAIQGMQFKISLFYWVLIIDILTALIGFLIPATVILFILTTPAIRAAL
jgi:hypothetical protein